MKTENLELTRTELQYLYGLVEDHIGSGIYWGDKDKFHKMQDRVLAKIAEAYDLIDPERKGFTGEY
jgi:hypothetical protein